MSRPSSSALDRAFVRVSSIHDAVRTRTPAPPPVTSLRFALPHDANAIVRVLDAQEREVCVVLQGALRAGEYHCYWNGRCGEGTRLPAGDYALRLEVDGAVLTSRRVTLR